MIENIEPAIFEQASSLWEQHPIPSYEAIDIWCLGFCARREILTVATKKELAVYLSQLLKALWNFTDRIKLDDEVKNWLKLLAFVSRKRDIRWDDSLKRRYD